MVIKVNMSYVYGDQKMGVGPSLIEAKYVLGPRKIYSNGGTVVVALGHKFKPLLGRYVLLTIEVLKEELEPPKPKVNSNPP